MSCYKNRMKKKNQRSLYKDFISISHSICDYRKMLQKASNEIKLSNNAVNNAAEMIDTLTCENESLKNQLYNLTGANKVEVSTRFYPYTITTETEVRIPEFRMLYRGELKKEHAKGFASTFYDKIESIILKQVKETK